MPTTYTYPDAYLARFCDEAREARAAADVALVGAAAGVTFSDDWTARLVVLQCYILAALENQADAEDLFAEKLKNYRQQMSAAVPQAVAAAKAAAGSITNIGLMSIPLERS